MGDAVIAVYRPKPGCEAELLELTREHVPFLRRLGYATDRPATVLRAQNGVIVEVFEWAPGAIDLAHKNPEVHALWARYEAVCNYVPLKDLPEAESIFAGFEPIDL